MNLPQATRDALDAEGQRRGRGWRSMPGHSETLRAIEWWLWKRGLTESTEERLGRGLLRARRKAEEAAAC